MASHNHTAREDKGALVHGDHTPYYFMNAFLVVFWFTYLGIAATYVVSLLILSETADTSLWVPVIFYSLSAAFLTMMIATMSMYYTLRTCDPHRALAMLKIPMLVAAAILLLRFLLPAIGTVQSWFM